jgi:uncharacterized protein
VRFIGALAAYLLFTVVAVAASFPALTGRVMDGAKIISPATKQQLTTQLAAHEQQTTNQMVIVTLPSLQGQPIEEYGVALGRHWAIGQKGKNNGLLFIIAPNDRQVRIEVGYGLEGVMTDAESSTIIQQIVLPEFKSGNYEAGIVKGTTSILGLLSHDAAITEEVHGLMQQNAGNDEPGNWVFLLIILIFFFHLRPLLAVPAQLLSWFGRPRFKQWMIATAAIPVLWWLLPKMRFGGGGFGGGGFGGGSSGSSFRGGGGSFGGGGSSGRW